VGSGAGLAIVHGGPTFVVLAKVHKWATYPVTGLIAGHILIASGMLPGYRGVWRSMHLGGRLRADVAQRLWPAWSRGGPGGGHQQRERSVRGPGGGDRQAGRILQAEDQTKSRQHTGQMLWYSADTHGQPANDPAFALTSRIQEAAEGRQRGRSRRRAAVLTLLIRTPRSS
jgi:hypothetical protein